LETPCFANWACPKIQAAAPVGIDDANEVVMELDSLRNRRQKLLLRSSY
jgi:hypothetical protein